MVGILKSAPSLFSWLFHSRNIVVEGGGGKDKPVSLSENVARLKAQSLYRSINGWYMLEVHNRSKEDFKGRIIANSKDCADGEQQFNVLCKSGRTSKRVVFFSSQTDLLLDCNFQAYSKDRVELSLVKISQAFAKSRMLRKVSVSNSVSLDDLYDMYCALFDSYDSANEYEIWKRLVEPQLWLPLMDVRALDKPLAISIVMPVFNPDLNYLQSAINSVLSQTNQAWELIIVDDCSTDYEVIKYLDSIMSVDSRITLVKRSENGHISEASNSAIPLVNGDYIALLDHDDLLSPHAINELVVAIAINPDAKLIYTDEDKLNYVGDRVDPHFKPDFSPETLLSQNYISHLTVVATDLMKKVGGFRTGVEGSQDHDLLLRLLPYLKSQDVVHIPKVLYHWRAVVGSTAMTPDEKSYTWSAGVKAVSDYLSAYGKSDFEVVYGRSPNTMRIKPKSIEGKVSIIIPTKNRLDLIQVCIDSIVAKTSYSSFEIIVVDNNSDDPQVLNYLKDLENRSIIKLVNAPFEFNYSKINNLAVKSASGELLCLLNNDTEIITENWLEELVMWATQPNIGCVGARLLYPDKTLQHGGVITGLGGVAGHSHLHLPSKETGYFDRMAIVNNVSAVTAACLMVKKSVYEKVGGLDETLKVAFNDIDFCLKVRDLGLRNVWTPFAELFHYESASRGYEVTPEKRARFNEETLKMKNRWGDTLKFDPFYNRNFDLYKESYRLRLSENA